MSSETITTTTNSLQKIHYGHNRVGSTEGQPSKQQQHSSFNAYAVNNNGHTNPAAALIGPGGDGDADSGMGDGPAVIIHNSKSNAATRSNKTRSESVHSNVSITRRHVVEVDDIVIGPNDSNNGGGSGGSGSGSLTVNDATAATTATNSTFSLGMPLAPEDEGKPHHPTQHKISSHFRHDEPSLHVPRPSISRPNSTKLDESAVAAALLLAKHPATGDEHWSQAVSLTTSKPDGPVKLRLTADTASIAPHTVYGMLNSQARAVPSLLALRVKRDGKWLEWTYRDYYEDVVRAAKGFIKLGLQPAHGVGILGFNAPEWFISDLGAITAGGLAVGIYTTNSPEACQYVAENSRCDIIVVEDDKYLDRILQVRSQLPDLKALIQYTGDINPKYADDAGIMTWAQFMMLSEDSSLISPLPHARSSDDEGTGGEGDFGADDVVCAGTAAVEGGVGGVDADDILQDRIDSLAPNKCCTIIYTSGTTGNPKGAMLSHDNVLFTAVTSARAAKLADDGSEVYISYLPLSHVAAQITDVYLPLVTAGCVNFAQPDALKGSLGDTLRDCRPTAILGVPRVWEKIQEKMQGAGRSSGFLKRHLAAWAKSVGLRGNRAILAGDPGGMPWGWSLAKMLVFKKVRQLLGLDRCRLCATGAAPITLDTLEYFLSLDVPIYEIYGMSESTGPHTVSLPHAHRLMSVGRPLPGCLVRIDKPDKDGNGEICMLGRNVFMGYLGMPDKTAEAIDAEGWLHSGDIGRVDYEGFLFITGRLKELIITAGGENVAPVPIEDMLKENCPLISNAMLIGDRRKFLSIIVTLKCEVDRESGAPTDTLLPLARDYVKAHAHVDVDTVSAARQNKAVRDLIQKAVDATNKKAVSRAARIAKFEILSQDFSVPGGELGPTMKLRRPVVMKMYHDMIEGLYAGGGGD